MRDVVLQCSARGCRRGNYNSDEWCSTISRRPPPRYTRIQWASLEQAQYQYTITLYAITMDLQSPRRILHPGLGGPRPMCRGGGIVQWSNIRAWICVSSNSLFNNTYQLLARNIILYNMICNYTMALLLLLVFENCVIF